ncbi:hypothetical protein GCM10023238_19950 [Streptomyces heliomycini]
MDDQAAGSPQDAQRVPVCYRHPDRETGVRCTRCERPICPECMVDAAVGFQCRSVRPHRLGHGARAHGLRAPHARRRSRRRGPRLITKILVGTCLAVFLVQLSLGDRFTDHFQLIGGRAYIPLLGSVEGIAEGQWYRLLTAMFLHGSAIHIIFNMLSLWWIGGPWKRRSAGPVTLPSTWCPDSRAARSRM